MVEKADTERNPFAHPGFIVGAVVVAALVATAIVLSVTNLGRGNDDAPPIVPSDAPRPTVTRTLPPVSVASARSAHGLESVELSGAFERLGGAGDEAA
ncbi:hypothetical protein [Microbacterium binotii]|uniref:hypothetical protein n=1 Tax=Microbacterium binotii TaxID=462710 RepID=UPI001F1CA190|nr:hypothetical protein [Microbacterium binotii]UIN30554.1 hypothetical protein LXM64_15630 [Microbacterium binotii]